MADTPAATIEHMTDQLALETAVEDGAPRLTLRSRSTERNSRVERSFAAIGDRCRMHARESGCRGMPRPDISAAASVSAAVRVGCR